MKVTTELLEGEGSSMTARIWALCTILNRLEGVVALDSELLEHDGAVEVPHPSPVWRVTFGIEGDGERCWARLQNIIAAVSCVPRTIVESLCEGMDPRGLLFRVKGHGDPLVVGEMIQIYSEAAESSPYAKAARKPVKSG